MQTVGDTLAHDRKSLWVFPEGTRSHGKGLGSFKKGAFHAAIASGLPITMVCASEYADRSSGLSGRREPVAVRILPPVETRGLTPADLPDLMARCHQQMADAIASITPAASVRSA